jgi:hypothetical protein
MDSQSGTAERVAALPLQREHPAYRTQPEQPEQFEQFEQFEQHGRLEQCGQLEKLDAAPVFVDPTGRRARLMRRWGAVAGMVLAGYTAIFCVGLVGGTPVAPPTLIPVGAGAVEERVPEAPGPR